jgi:hypothetical protein
VTAERPSVSGNGGFAIYIGRNNNKDGDLCIIATDTPDSQYCLGRPGEIYSIAIAPKANNDTASNRIKFAYVVKDPSEGERERHKIIVVEMDDPTDFSNNVSQKTLAIQAPTTIFTDISDGVILENIITQVDQLDFSASGKYIYFSALNEITYTDIGTKINRSIYSVNISTEHVRSIIAPNKNIDFAYPSLANTSDRYMTFTGEDNINNATLIFVADLDSGIAKLVASTDTTALNPTPSFNGNDSAIIYSEYADNDTQSHLMRQNISTIDHMTAIGTPTEWEPNAKFGVIYRRGDFHGPNTYPKQVAIVSPVPVDDYVEIKADDGVIFIGAAVDEEGDDIEYEWRIYDIDNNFIESAYGKETSEIVFPTNGEYTVKLIATDSFGASDPNPATVVIHVTGGNIPPQVSIKSPTDSTTKIQVGQTIQFEGSATDPDGVELTYSWELDGELLSNAAKPDPVTFNTVNETGYEITLIITDALGGTGTAKVLVIVSEEDPNSNQPEINDSKPSDNGGGGSINVFFLIAILLARFGGWGANAKLFIVA